MLSNRSIGIRTLTLICLLGLVTLSFWSWLFIWEGSLLTDGEATQRYFLYNEFLLIGILFGLSGKRHTQGPHHEFVDAVRRSGKQVVFGLFGVFVVVFVLKDLMVSRLLFF